MSSIVFFHPSSELYGADKILTYVLRAHSEFSSKILILPSNGPLVDLLHHQFPDLQIIIEPRMPIVARKNLHPLGILRLIRDLCCFYRLYYIARESDVLYFNTLAVLPVLFFFRTDSIKVLHVHEILDNSNTNETSIYTLDVDYTTAEYLSAFKFKNVTNISVYAGDQTVGTGSWEDYSGWETVESIISQMQTLFDEKLSNYQAENFELLNQTLPTASELWNLSTNNTWHDFLKNYIGNQVGVRFDITGSTLATPYGTTTASDENNSIMITYDFSDFSLTPVGISVDTPNLIF